MKAYGNLINRILEHSGGVPVVGMPATIHWWSDRTPGTVTKVSPSGKTVEITEDRVTKWEHSYGVTFEADPNGRVHTARLTKKGTWRAAGNGVSLGNRSAYRDPHF